MHSHAGAWEREPSVGRNKRSGSAALFLAEPLRLFPPTETEETFEISVSSVFSVVRYEIILTLDLRRIGMQRDHQSSHIRDIAVND